MKAKILLIVCSAIFFANVTKGQVVQKSNWLLGGTLGFNSNNGNGTNQTSSSTSNANIAPHIGLAVGGNSVVGLNFSANFQTTSGGFHSWSYVPNVFFKHFFQVKNRFGLYGQLSGGAGWSKSDYQTADPVTGNLTKSHITSSLYNVGLVPGVYFAATPGILINADFGGINYNYNHYKGFDGSSGNTSNFNINLLSSFTFGVDFILVKHKG